MDNNELRQVLGHFATGVAIVTGLKSRGDPVGLTINSFSSVSLEPPLVLWSLSDKSTNLDAFACGRPFVINILSARQRDICLHFARPLQDKFTDVAIEAGLDGVPLLQGSLAYLECRTEKVIPAGDHVLFMGRVLEFRTAAAEAPLIFHRSRLSELYADAPC